VALWPQTGRMHQIRQHLRYIGHPVWGDRRYGGRALPDFSGHLLHSFRTVLNHPVTGGNLDLVAPVPENFLPYLRQLAGNTYPSLLNLLAELASAQ
jgi:23S rRNA-/tRNA-specific pseudouridylate synthase